MITTVAREAFISQALALTWVLTSSAESFGHIRHQDDYERQEIVIDIIDICLENDNPCFGRSRGFLCRNTISRQGDCRVGEGLIRT